MRVAAIITGFLVIWLAALVVTAFGHEPSEPFAAWFNSLKQPDTGISCCSVSDCRPVDYRVAQDRYEAAVADAPEGWLPIPSEKIVHRENPTGRAVLCRSPSTGTIFCFVPANET